MEVDKDFISKAQAKYKEAFKEKLSKESYKVAFNKGTELPFSNEM